MTSKNVFRCRFNCRNLSDNEKERNDVAEFIQQLKEDQNDKLLERLIGELAHPPGRRKRQSESRVAQPFAFSCM